MSDTQAIKESVLSLLNKDNIIRFYLKTEDKKITYEDFESEILKKEELNNFGEESIFKDKKVISFSRDKIKEEIFDFLGMAINSKKMASKLLNELPMIYVKESQYKI
jgi:DNA-binding MltR family transcriptional regulator